MWRRVASLAVGLMVVAGCTDDVEPQTETQPPASAPTGDRTRTPTDDAPEPRVKPFDEAAVLSDIRTLANRIGPREATSKGFRLAAGWVTDRFESLGYDVRRVRVHVPAGDSWGVPVDSGTSYNLIAELPRFDEAKPYRIVGAHLDSVAVSPGAEDNGSGTSVMLELARMTAEQPPDVPVRFIAFGAEEPRGTSDNMHHFGSRRYVRRMSRSERANLDGMVALDRVGVRAPAVPICSAFPDDGALRREVVRAARHVHVPYRPCHDRVSDHWSFAKADLPAIRLGSVPYAGYHSAQDLPHFIDEREVRRVGRIMWRWLTRST